MKKKKTLGYVLMVVLLFIWGFDYIAAKWTLGAFSTWSTMFIKYFLGLIVISIIMFATKSRTPLKSKKDLIMFGVAAFLGEIMYFFCEYNAMDYLAVGLITSLLAFIPAVTVIVERIIYKQKITPKIIVGIIGSVIGVALLSGFNPKDFAGGKAIGYLFVIGVIVAWTSYNFVTERMGDEYNEVSMSFYMMCWCVLMSAPKGIAEFPGFHVFSNPKIVAGVLYLGIAYSAAAFFILIFVITTLGPTASSVGSNFLPVSTALMGLVFLGEKLKGREIIGMVIILIFGCLILIEKARVRDAAKNNQEEDTVDQA